MKKCILLFFSVIVFAETKAQTSTTPSQESISPPIKSPTFNVKDGFKLNFNDDGSHFVKLTFLNQVWVRFNENNPNSTVYGTPQKEKFDIGLRRSRIQLYGQISDKVFFYGQFGMNNFNYLSDRQANFFIHDMIGEYAVAKKYLSIGTGLTGWSGLSRFASPSVGTIMCLDAPLYQQATNGATDQFLRKLSIYAKGKLGKLDYRVAITSPMVIQKAAAGAGAYETSVSKNSSFALTPPSSQFQGYFMYQFLDQESNMTPYTTGTYLGAKRVFNIGAGAVYQQNAMWHGVYNNSTNPKLITDTLKTNLMLWAIDVYYDAPINKEKGTAISFYGAFSDYDFGSGYLRNNGPLNPANGTKVSTTFNGTGNNAPLIGTGNIAYAQVGYLLPKKLLGENGGQLQPYANIEYGMFSRTKDPMQFWSTGFNWLISGHSSKLSLEYQSRPIYSNVADSNGKLSEIKSARRGAIIMQYQVSF